MLAQQAIASTPVISLARRPLAAIERLSRQSARLTVDDPRAPRRCLR